MELGGFFAPRRVVMLGASDRSHLARSVWDAIAAGGYRGEMIAINPNRDIVFGKPCMSSLSAVGGDVDLALVAVGEANAETAVRDVIAARIPRLMLFTDFAGTEEGRARRKRVADLCVEAGIAVCGSVTFGLFDLVTGFMPLMGRPMNLRPGNVALVCQSGGLLNALCRALDDVGVGLRRAAATGGEDGLSAADFIGHMLEDEQVRAIGCVAEQVKGLADFRKVASLARDKGVPIVMLKIGRSEKGAQAALAHSGALATDNAVLSGLFRQAGIIEADNISEMVALLATQSKLAGRIEGRRAHVITISGGETGLAADLAAKHGLALPELGVPGIAALQEALGSSARYGNPVDTANGSLSVLTDMKAYVRAVACLREEPGADILLVRYLEQPGIYEGLAELALRAGRPVALYTRTVWDCSHLPEGRSREATLLLPDIELAIAAIAKLGAWHEPRAAWSPSDIALPPVELPPLGPGVVGEDQCLPMLNGCGLEVPPMRVVPRGADARLLAAQIPGPYVVKILSETILHRRAAGGVIVGADGPKQAAEAAATLFDRFAPGDVARLAIASMQRFDMELIMGARRLGDGTLVLMIGWGGTFVEDLAKTALRLSPLSPADVADMIAEIDLAAPLRRLALERAEGILQRLKEALLRFDDLCRRIGPSLAEWDVNPVAIDAREGRLIALDAKLLLEGS